MQQTQSRIVVGEVVVEPPSVKPAVARPRMESRRRVVRFLSDEVEVGDAIEPLVFFLLCMLNSSTRLIVIMHAISLLPLNPCKRGFEVHDLTFALNGRLQCRRVHANR